MADLIGQKLGQYEITGKLGSGGMATVYRARQSSVGRDVAIKVIESRLAENPEFLKRFEREARTIAALSHPHILKLFDFGQQGEMLYLVMELLSGGSLADLISKERLPLKQVSRLLEQIASALDYAHERGIIHRDLKPQNVLLDEKGNAILTDFGIAKVLNETTALTASGMSIGTPAYMSPEQCQGRALDGRSDMYSLGIMLFEMLTGEVPFKGDTPVSMIYMHLSEMPPPITSIRPDLPLSVEQVINKGLAKDPMQRFQSAGDLAAAFKIALTGQTPPGVETPPQAEVNVTAPLTAGTPESPGQRGRSTWLLALGGLVLVAVIGVLVVVLASGGQKANPTQAATIATPAVGLPTQTVTSLPPTETSTLIPSQAATLTATLTTTLTLTEEPNLETLAAQTLAVEAAQTAQVIASYTRTPTNTPTNTPNKQQTLAAMVAATKTVNAIASFTQTPTATFTATPMATFTLTPTATFTLTPSWTFIPPLTPTLTSTSTVTLEPTFSPSPKRTDEHGIAQVYVPAGCFMMGSTDQQIAELVKQYNKDWFNNQGPQHQVCITQGYWLDAYEVTNAAYQQFIDAGGYTTRAYWSEAGWSWKGSRAAPDDCGSQFDAPQQPRVCVTSYEAEAYAKWRGGRLPTEAEWEYAARGPESLLYPWGNVWDGSRANTAETAYGKTKPVCSYESGKSWVGAYDLAGNVWEWTADWYGYTYYQQQVKDDPKGPDSGQSRVLRGGSWNFDSGIARSAYRLDSNTLETRSYDFGLRVIVETRPSAPNAPTATLSPTLAPGTKRADDRGIAQVYVPAGCFLMGSDPVKDSQAQSNEQPQHQVCITQGYWMDAYEVTNAAYQAFIDAGGYTTRSYWSDAGWSWKDSSTTPQDCGSQFKDPQQPRVCVTWYEAEAYAKWRGGRLPTEAEWEYAARGPDSLIYPWGNTWDSSKTNTRENKYEKTKPVSSYENGKSWVGAYDLAGNVWEWVADWYGDTYYRPSEKGMEK